MQNKFSVVCWKCRSAHVVAREADAKVYRKFHVRRYHGGRGSVVSILDLETGLPVGEES